MVRYCIERLGKHLKGGVFTVDPRIPTVGIMFFVLSRASQAVRGLLSYCFLRKGSAVPIFIGRNVTLRNKRNIRIGRGATIGDGVVIEGLSASGIDIGMGVNIGAHSIIMPTSVVRNLGHGLIIGRNSGIGQFSFIGCGGGVKIGSDVIMGQYVSFHTENHIFTETDVPIRLQGVIRLSIEVGDDCWVGAKATFLSGAKLGRGCVVAAGSVVRGEIPPYSVIGGVPAKIISARSVNESFGCVESVK